MNQSNHRRNFRPRFLMRGAAGVALLLSAALAAMFAATFAAAQTPAVETIAPAVTRSLAQSASEAVATIAGGVWVKTSYSIAGRWSIVARGDKRTIEFDDDFKTRRGPDLKVYLSTRAVEALTDGTVAANSTEIAALKSNRGAQVYEIPARLDLNDYRSVLIHCKRFSHLWGGGNFTP